MAPTDDVAMIEHISELLTELGDAEVIIKWGGKGDFTSRDFLQKIIKSLCSLCQVLMYILLLNSFRKYFESHVFRGFIIQILQPRGGKWFFFAWGGKKKKKKKFAQHFSSLSIWVLKREVV